MLEIRIIASQPYCPASALLIKRVREISELHFDDRELSIRVEACDNEVVYDEWAAAKAFGFDRSLLDREYARLIEEKDGIYRPQDLYTAKAAALRQDLLDAVNKNDAMLAPLLFINGNILSEGICPDPCRIEEWIRASLG